MRKDIAWGLVTFTVGVACGIAGHSLSDAKAVVVVGLLAVFGAIAGTVAMAEG